MLTIMIGLLWVIGVVSYLYYESAYGFGFEFPAPFDTIVTALIWPVSVPLILMHSFFKRLENIKNQRKVKEKEECKIRLKTEKDLKEALEQVEEEFGSYEKQKR